MRYVIDPPPDEPHPLTPQGSTRTLTPQSTGSRKRISEKPSLPALQKQVSAMLDGDGFNIKKVPRRRSLALTPRTLMRLAEVEAQQSSKLLRVLRPSDLLVIVWACLVDAFILYNMISFPLIVCFTLEASAGWRVVGSVGDFVFLLDIFFHCNVALDTGGHLEFDRARITKHYAQTWAMFDVLAMLPLDLFLAGMGGEWTRVNRFMKVFRIWTHFRGVKSRVNSGITRLAKIVFWNVVIAHWLACLFYAFARVERAYGVDTVWLQLNQLEFADTVTVYIHCLYWSVFSLTTVGFGDVQAATVYERVFTMFVMLLSSVLFAIAFGNLASLLRNLDRETRQFRLRIKEVIRYMEKRSIPTELTDRVLSYFNSLYFASGLSQSKNLLSDLPASLQSELSMHLQSELVSKVPLFQEFNNPGFITAIVSVLEMQTFLPQDYVVRYNDIGKDMFFISKGEAVVEIPLVSKKFKLEEGSYFGEVALFDKAFQRRTASVLSVGYSTMLRLTKANLDQVLEHYPALRVLMQKAAQEKLAMLEQQRKVDNDTAAAEADTATKNDLSPHRNSARMSGIDNPECRASTHSTKRPSMLSTNFVRMFRAPSAVSADYARGLTRIDFESFANAPGRVQWYLRCFGAWFRSLALRDQSSVPRWLWNILMFATTSYCTFYVAFQVAFVPYAWDPVCQGFFYFSELAFVCDIFLKLVTGFPDEGNLCLDVRRCVYKYSHSLDFLICVASVLPFDLFFLGTDVAPFLRLNRLLRYGSVFNYIRSYTANGIPLVEGSVARVGKLAFFVFYSAHVIGCFFALLGFLYIDDPGSWFHKADLADAPTSAQYATSFYWVLTVLTTIGLGDISTTTNPERVFAIVVMYVGISLNVYIFGTMASLISEMDSSDEDFRRRIDAIHGYLRTNNVTADLRDRILGHVTAVHNNLRGVDEKMLMASLPKSCREDLAIYENEDLVSNCVLFSCNEPSFLRAVLVLMKRQFLLPHEYVCRSGEIANFAIFVKSGMLHIVDKDADGNNQVIRTLEDGDYFGENGLMKSSLHTVSVITASPVELLTLTRRDFQSVVQFFPDHYNRIKAHAGWGKVRGVVRRRAMYNIFTRGAVPAPLPANPDDRLAHYLRPTPLASITRTNGSRLSSNDGGAGDAPPGSARGRSAGGDARGLLPPISTRASTSSAGGLSYPSPGPSPTMFNPFRTTPSSGTSPRDALDPSTVASPTGASHNELVPPPARSTRGAGGFFPSSPKHSAASEGDDGSSSLRVGRGGPRGSPSGSALPSPYCAGCGGEGCAQCARPFSLDVATSPQRASVATSPPPCAKSLSVDVATSPLLPARRQAQHQDAASSSRCSDHSTVCFSPAQKRTPQPQHAHTHQQQPDAAATPSAAVWSDHSTVCVDGGGGGGGGGCAPSYSDGTYTTPSTRCSSQSLSEGAEGGGGGGGSGRGVGDGSDTVGVLDSVLTRASNGRGSHAGGGEHASDSCGHASDRGDHVSYRGDHASYRDCHASDRGDHVSYGGDHASYRDGHASDRGDHVREHESDRREPVREHESDGGRHAGDSGDHDSVRGDHHGSDGYPGSSDQASDWVVPMAVHPRVDVTEVTALTPVETPTEAGLDDLIHDFGVGGRYQNKRVR